MNFRPELSPRPSQGLRLTPGLRRGLSILRMNAVDLAEELRRAAADNPLIKLEENTPEEARDSARFEADSLPSRETLAENLRRQVALMALDPRVAAIAQFLCGDIDETGYISAEAVEDTEEIGATRDQAEAALAAIQSCDPPGIGARTLEECLALQMRDRGIPEPTARAACTHLDLLADRRFGELSRRTGLPESDLSALAGMLPSLNPRPGEALHDQPLPALPEIIVEHGPDGLFLATPDRHLLPRAELDPDLAGTLSGNADFREARDQAQEMIQALRYRERLLDRLARLIVSHQHRFFAEGPAHLVPMTRTRLARALDVHPSTVGRALAGKSLSFRGTVYPLSLFVSPALATTGEGSVTAHAVQGRIRTLIEDEPPDAVLSDDRLAEILRGEGVDIARRTVAKYRRCLTIPSSFERKRRKAGRPD